MELVVAWDASWDIVTEGSASRYRVSGLVIQHRKCI